MVVTLARRRLVVGHAHLGLELPQGDGLGARAGGDEPAVHLRLLLGGVGQAQVEVPPDVGDGLVPVLEAARADAACSDRCLDPGGHLDAVRLRTAAARRLKQGVALLRERRSLLREAARVV